MRNYYIMNLIKSEPVAVVGLGISNLPLVDFLLSHGARVTVYEKKGREVLGELADRLSLCGVKLVLGEDCLERVRERVIFRTPGIRADRINAPGDAYFTSETELFFELCPSKIYAITGSDGKTTTTTLTHLFLATDKARDGKGKALVGGNIGAPLLPHVDELCEDDAAVLELSSFQLMGMRHSPDAAAITNITPNHLNWHRDMAEYTAAKYNICGKRTGRVVLNADNALTLALECGEARPIYFSSTKSREKMPEGAQLVYISDGSIVFFDGESEQTLLALSDIKLRGRHNIENYMTAIALTYGDVSPEVYREIARDFGGVEHRLELVAEKGGVRYYNSSIDSTPTRTAAALSALDERPIVICGGADKNTDYAPLAELLASRAKAVVLNGETAKKIRAALDACPEFLTSGIPVYIENSLDAATDRAISIAERGDTVLLSPASTSFDQFVNFEERGRAFKRKILALDEEN